MIKGLIIPRKWQVIYVTLSAGICTLFLWMDTSSIAP